MIPVLVAHAVATCVMIGVIWFVQLVHYPLMREVHEVRFGVFQEQHSRRTTWVVAVPMLVEAITAIWLVWRPSSGSLPMAWTGLGLLAVIWLSTAFLQVPCHRILGAGFSPAAHARLVRTNWIRTLAWTLRGAVAITLLSRTPAP